MFKKSTSRSLPDADPARVHAARIGAVTCVTLRSPKEPRGKSRLVWPVSPFDPWIDVPT
jgi:hypothetical protein